MNLFLNKPILNTNHENSGLSAIWGRVLEHQSSRVPGLGTACAGGNKWTHG
jgi:hypothetical protein